MYVAVKGTNQCGVCVCKYTYGQKQSFTKIESANIFELVLLVIDTINNVS